MKRTALMMVVLAFCYSNAFAAATGSAGGLDASFGVNGLVKTSMSPFPGTDEITAMVVQPNGKIVAVGRAGADSGIIRYNSDGSIDTAFGTNGIITSSLGSYYAIALQEDGKILVGGISTSMRFAIARYNSSGSPDLEFGTGGITEVDVIAGEQDFIFALAIQMDGKILAAGSSGTSYTSSSVAVARFTKDGFLDSGFGVNGIVTQNVGDGLSRAQDMALQADGKIVITGWYRLSADPVSGARYGWMLLRLDESGSLDPDFDSDGVVTTAIGVNFNSYYLDDYSYGIAIQHDGKILAAGGTGTSCMPPNCFSEDAIALARYLPDGSLDPIFGQGGMQAFFGLAMGYAKDLAIQSDGKIVVGGPVDGKGYFRVARFTNSGIPDPSFGVEVPLPPNSFLQLDNGNIVQAEKIPGEVIFEGNGSGFWKALSNIVIQPDGQILAGGYECGGGNGVNQEFAIIRLWPGAGSPLIDFDRDGKSDKAVWRPDTGVWYILPSASPGTPTATQWGISEDRPVLGDYDGDGRKDVGVWRPSAGMWFILPSNSPGSYSTMQWGAEGDIPVPGDYDGDGKTDLAAWRPGIGTWFVVPSRTPADRLAIQWGTEGDVPVPANYDGDGNADLAVWRPSNGMWFVYSSRTPGSYSTTQWGLSSDIPVPGDFDGDGKIDVSVWRPDAGIWFIKPSADPETFIIRQWGSAEDIPVAADFDGDGKADIAVWRPDPGMWFILPSASPESYTITQWGADTDIVISPLTEIMRLFPQ